MDDTSTVTRARLIRYTTVAGQDHPNLLSVFDSSRNLQMIDIELSASMPRQMREFLEMSTIPATMITNETTGSFGPYVQPTVVQEEMFHPFN